MAQPKETMPMNSLISFLNLFQLLLLASSAMPMPSPPERLSTNGRWIVDGSGHRVKLACVNWPSHLEVVVAEGLSKHPVDGISEEIKSSGFNCVRLTWPLFLFTNDTLGSRTVRQSFKSLQLVEAISGLEANNPNILDLSLIDAYKEVVASLGRKNVMAVLDNHISKPGWCCSNTDGNGFFGDQYFNPDLWIKGLTRVANTFKSAGNVVAMSLRNELRGPRQNVNDWYRYMQRGAEAVHAANPSILVILSGLSFDTDLYFLASRPVSVTFSRKLVFEVHWYGFSDGKAWERGNPNQVCGQVMSDTMKRAGFVLSQGYPLFVSEFGVNMQGSNVNDNRYLNCFMGWAAEFDVDWALWTLTGSYYLRQGVVGLDETYGVYDWNWCRIRNQSVLHKISTLQYPFQGPGYAEVCPHKVLFHPMTGLCVKKTSWFEPLELGPCSKAEAWSYTPQKTLAVQETYLCLQADGLGQPAKLGFFCRGPNFRWEAVSDSKMHLSSKLDDGTSVCLEAGSDNVIMSNNCKCQDNRDNKCDPGSQWFKIIDSTRHGSEESSLPKITSAVKFMAKNLLLSFT